MVNSGVKGDRYMNMKEIKHDLGVLCDEGLSFKLPVDRSIFHGCF